MKLAEFKRKKAELLALWPGSSASFPFRNCNSWSLSPLLHTAYMSTQPHLEASQVNPKPRTTRLCQSTTDHWSPTRRSWLMQRTGRLRRQRTKGIKATRRAHPARRHLGFSRRPVQVAEETPQFPEHRKRFHTTSEKTPSGDGEEHCIRRGIQRWEPRAGIWHD
ncbi:hypothetical protein B0T24DRAFT_72372 [Lasiosphaeria ovina]|uniref:Uncharacterized protein n=1 Tax=Lasiosphaeria ovina TaxID=92902 RepID=A0AAE0NM60_9PEZI|nr:hypothetical protein B0T24DRAFT_72372 [Lasiosphaeria ovina]